MQETEPAEMHYYSSQKNHQQNHPHRRSLFNSFYFKSAVIIFVIFAFVYTYTKSSEKATLLAKLNVDLAGSRQREEALSAQLQVINEHKTRLEKNLEETKGGAQRERNDLESKLKSAQEETNNERNQREELQKQYESLQQQLNELKNERADSQTEMSKKLEELKTQNDDLINNLKDAETEKGNLQEQLHQCQQRREEAKKALESLGEVKKVEEAPKQPEEQPAPAKEQPPPEQIEAPKDEQEQKEEKLEADQEHINKTSSTPKKLVKEKLEEGQLPVPIPGEIQKERDRHRQAQAQGATDKVTNNATQPPPAPRAQAILDDEEDDDFPVDENDNKQEVAFQRQEGGNKPLHFAKPPGTGDRVKFDREKPDHESFAKNAERLEENEGADFREEPKGRSLLNQKYKFLEDENKAKEIHESKI